MYEDSPYRLDQMLYTFIRTHDKTGEPQIQKLHGASDDSVEALVNSRPELHL